MRDISIIKRRSEILRQIRNFFYYRDFLEVQTPTLLPDTMVDEFIDPISVAVSGIEQPLYLQTSPEFAMKRLLLDGCKSIFEITPAYRDAEFGKQHNVEFTMLEWYRVGDDYDTGMDLLAEFCQHFFPHKAVEKVAYRDVFQSNFWLNPHTAKAPDFQAVAEKLKIDIPESADLLDRDAWMQLLMTSNVDANLGMDSATILYDWPASQCALAKTRTVNPIDTSEREQAFDVAERFELYVDGVELANGYHELCDGEEQHRRLEQTNDKRIATGKTSLPTESYLTESMCDSPLPNCSGVALGVDRLIMLLLGLDSISEV